MQTQTAPQSAEAFPGPSGGSDLENTTHNDADNDWSLLADFMKIENLLTIDTRIHIRPYLGFSTSESLRGVSRRARPTRESSTRLQRCSGTEAFVLPWTGDYDYIVCEALQNLADLGILFSGQNVFTRRRAFHHYNGPIMTPPHTIQIIVPLGFGHSTVTFSSDQFEKTEEWESETGWILDGNTILCAHDVYYISILGHKYLPEAE